MRAGGGVGGLCTVSTPVENKNQNQINPWIVPQMLLLGHCSLSFPRVLGFSIQVQFSSVTQSCPTLCDPMDCSTPGFPVPHKLPELAHTHVHQVSDAISSSVVPFSSCLQSFPSSGSLQMSQLFASGGQSTGVSASTSVLPMNTQD